MLLSHNSIAGVLGQIGAHTTDTDCAVTTKANASWTLLRLCNAAAVSEHALELLKELQSESLALDRRLDGVRTRIDAIAGHLDSGHSPATDKTQEDEQSAKSSDCKGAEPYTMATRAKVAMPPAVRAAYDACEPVPALHTVRP